MLSRETMLPAVHALLLGWAGVAPAPTSTAASGYALEWTAPSTCPSRDVIVEQIDELVASDREHRVFVSAEGTVVLSDERWTLTLAISTESGRRVRTVQADGCAELTSIAALLVAIAIDPGLAGAAGEPAPTAATEPATAGETEDSGPSEPSSTDDASTPPIEPPPPAQPEHAPPPADEPEANIPPTRTLGGYVVAGVGLSTGTLPSVTPLVRLGGGLDWRVARLELGARYRFPRRITGGRAELWTVAGDVRGCGVPHVPNVVFPLCAGIELGAVAGRSFDIREPGRGRAPWVVVHAGGGLVAKIGRRIGIAVDADLLVPIVRAGFEVEGLGELYRVGPVGLDASVGVEVTFP